MNQICYFGSNPASIERYRHSSFIQDNKAFLDITEDIIKSYNESELSATMTLSDYAKFKFNLEKDSVTQLYGAWFNKNGLMSEYVISNYLQNLIVLKNTYLYHERNIPPYLSKKQGPTIIIPSTLDIEKTNLNIRNHLNKNITIYQQHLNLKSFDQEKYILECIDNFYQYTILYDLTIENKRDIRTLNDTGLIYFINTY